MLDTFKLDGYYSAEFYHRWGPAKWFPKTARFFMKHGKLFHTKYDEAALKHNLIVNEGLQHTMDTEFSGGTPVDPWYLGLTDGTPTVNAADTLASHAGWVEQTDYTGDRQAWVEVRSGQTMTNSASVAVFPITGTMTVGGGFLCSVATTTTGTLMSVGALTGGDRPVINGDTINLTYTLVGSDV